MSLVLFWLFSTLLLWKEGLNTIIYFKPKAKRDSPF